MLERSLETVLDIFDIGWSPSITNSCTYSTCISIKSLEFLHLLDTSLMRLHILFTFVEPKCLSATLWMHVEVLGLL